MSNLFLYSVITYFYNFKKYTIGETQTEMGG